MSKDECLHPLYDYVKLGYAESRFDTSYPLDPYDLDFVSYSGEDEAPYRCEQCNYFQTPAREAPYANRIRLRNNPIS